MIPLEAILLCAIYCGLVYALISCFLYWLVTSMLLMVNFAGQEGRGDQHDRRKLHRGDSRISHQVDQRRNLTELGEMRQKIFKFKKNQ